MTPDTPTPDGPPAAAPERKAGERLPVGDRFIVGGGDSCDVWEATGADPILLARDLKNADAKFLVHGPARLRAMEVAVADFVEYAGAGYARPFNRLELLLEAERVKCRNQDDRDYWRFLGEKLTALRASLRAGPGGGT
jgi:hypothetical protein